MDEYYNCIIEKLKSNTTYYFRARRYKIVDGVKYYSSWSPARRIKTLKTNSKSPNCKNFKNPGWNPDPYAYLE